MTADRCKMEGRLSTGPSVTQGEHGVSGRPASIDVPSADKADTNTPDLTPNGTSVAPTKCQHADSTMTDVTNNNVKSKSRVVLICSPCFGDLLVFGRGAVMRGLTEIT